LRNGKKETRKEKSKKNLRTTLGKRSYSQKLEFFRNYKIMVGIWLNNRDINEKVEEGFIIFGLTMNVDICLMIFLKCPCMFTTNDV
jgi:hypothetical protein